MPVTSRFSARMPQPHKTVLSSQRQAGEPIGVEQERVAEPWRLAIVHVIALKVFNEIASGGQMKTTASGSSARLSKHEQAAAMLQMYKHQVPTALSACGRCAFSMSLMRAVMAHAGEPIV